MDTLNYYVTDYLEYCKYRKRLTPKTLKAYRIDLTQYTLFAAEPPACFSQKRVDQYVTQLHKQYKPKSIKSFLYTLNRSGN